jgi:hypothetical protein
MVTKAGRNQQARADVGGFFGAGSQRIKQVAGQGNKNYVLLALADCNSRMSSGIQSVTTE